MPFADKISPAPRAVRLAGALTVLPGLAALVLAALVLVTGLGQPQHPAGNVYAEAGYYVVIGLGTVACGVGLLLGKTWARSPTVVVALLLVGIGWYTTGPSGAPGVGIPFMTVGVLAIVLLFRAPSRAWVLGMRADETEQQAADRGGAAGRAARRSDNDE